MQWTNHNNYIIGKYLFTRPNYLSKIASFDLDFTIIKPTGKKRFSKTDTDWEFYDDTVINKIQEYHNKKYKIVIVSNQKGISLGKTDINQWKNKIEKIAKQLQVPFIILVSLCNDMYRKPRTCLWDKYIRGNRSKSFYCGDAGGLPKRQLINNKHVPRDFSDSDLKFALNLGVKFIHRDEFINKNELTQNYIPKHVVDWNNIQEGEEKYKFVPNHTEIIINVGYPGSGKSHYTKKYVLDSDNNNKYIYINQDQFKTLNQCIDTCKIALRMGNSVIIDNTNPSILTRKKYIDLAKKYNVKIRCLNFTTSMELSKHNNIYRHIVSNKRPIVPNIAYNIFKKKYEIPTKKEGFYRVENIEFILDRSIVQNCYFYYLE